MLQPPRFKRPAPPLPARDPSATPQHDYKMASLAHRIGFAGLVLGLGALTFAVTVGGVDVLSERRSARANVPVATATASVTTIYSSGFFWSGKDEDRLPVFGGQRPVR